MRASDEDYDHEVEANLTEEEQNEFNLISEVCTKAVSLLCVGAVMDKDVVCDLCHDLIHAGCAPHPCALRQAQDPLPAVLRHDPPCVHRNARMSIAVLLLPLTCISNPHGPSRTSNGRCASLTI